MPKPNKSNVGLGPTFDEFYATIQDILQFITAKQENYPSTYKQVSNLPPTEEHFNLFLGQVLYLMNEWFEFEDFGVSYSVNLRRFFENPESYISIELTRKRPYFTEDLQKTKSDLISMPLSTFLIIALIEISFDFPWSSTVPLII
jgi:hypothetical protein